MRTRLIAFGLVAVVLTAGCSQGDNVDFVLTPGESKSQPDTSEEAAPTDQPNTGGIAIDRSALPTTPSAADGVVTTTSTTTIVGGESTSTESSASADSAVTADGSDTATAPVSPNTPNTPTPSNAPPPSLAPSDSIGWLWPSLTDMASAWDTGRTTIEASPFAKFDPASAKTGALSIGGQGFADRAAVPGGVLGGTIENDRDISSMLVIVPNNVDLPQAMQSLWVTLDGTPAEVAIFDGMQKFSEFVAEGIPAEGTQTWISTSGSTYSIVLTVVSGSLIASDTNAIEVAVIPVADEGLAKSMAQPLRVELLSLLS